MLIKITTSYGFQAVRLSSTPNNKSKSLISEKTLSFYVFAVGVIILNQDFDV